MQSAVLLPAWDEGGTFSLTFLSIRSNVEPMQLNEVFSNTHPFQEDDRTVLQNVQDLEDNYSTVIIVLYIIRRKPKVSTSST